jgi:hypothetical protein
VWAQILVAELEAKLSLLKNRIKLHLHSPNVRFRNDTTVINENKARMHEYVYIKKLNSFTFGACSCLSK